MTTTSKTRKNKHDKSLKEAKRFIAQLKIGEDFTFKGAKEKMPWRGIDVRGAMMDLVEEKRIRRVGKINLYGGGTTILYRRIS